MIEQAIFNGTAIQIGRKEVQTVSIINTILDGKEPDVRDQLWDNWAPDYQRFLKLTSTRKAWNDFIQTVTPTQDSLLFFDAGCGDGEIIEGLVKRLPNSKIIGADKSVEFLQRAQIRLATKLQDAVGRVSLWRVDLTKPFPWDNETFDGATMNFVFQYLSRDEQEHVIGEMERVLKPGGKLHLSTFVDGRSFKEVAPKEILKDLLRGNLVGVILASSKLSITRQFDKLRERGFMNHPFVTDLEQMHRGAGFSDFEIADRKFSGIEVISIATK
ncbi:MAG: methyltransferase domain-containing protein [Candidatus Daviesbacteria bacterium]